MEKWIDGKKKKKKKGVSDMVHSYYHKDEAPLR
jgi:hypothetical protein